MITIIIYRNFRRTRVRALIKYTYNRFFSVLEPVSQTGIKVTYIGRPLEVMVATP
jgi:hypothetical protein